MIATDAQTDLEASPGLPRWLTSPRGFLVLITGYFALHVGLRLITSSTADLDEAEQLVATQQFAWGYGAQPPLYTWLQLPLVKLFGPIILPLALLKAVLLTTLYAFTYLNARRVLKAHAPAVLATLLLMFIPQIAWESQRDLTHSVLVTVFAVLTFHALLRLAEGQSLSRYALLGLVAGGGFLAKYSFGIFLAGLTLAVLSVPNMRKLVFDRRILISVTLCVGIVAPTALWAMENREIALSAAQKLSLGNRDLSWGESVLKGLGKYLTAIVSHLGPLLGILAIILGARLRAGRSRSNQAEPLTKIIWRGLLIISVMLAAGILLSGASRFLDRWLMPVCVWLPILLVARFRDSFDGARTRVVCGVSVIVAAVICVAIPTRIWFAERLNWPQSLNAPFEALAAQLREVSPGPELIVAENAWLAGNLRKQFPARRVVCPTVLLPDLLRPGEPCLVVCDLTRKDAPTDQFRDFCKDLLATDDSLARAQSVTASLKYFSQKQAKLLWTRDQLKAAPESSAR